MQGLAILQLFFSKDKDLLLNWNILIAINFSFD